MIQKQNNVERKRVNDIEAKQDKCSFKKSNSTSTQRMRKLRARRRKDNNFNMEEHYLKERERLAKLRSVQKIARERNSKLLREYRKKQKLSKREQRK